ncbi:MAG TPA: hypothetical protein VKZ87_06985 [Ferrovibrio sp.]|uniref:hypothetical protein n=1 Tax=Ferrovibrio sp. TaxID=1917215 RepID=UPI002B4B811E|nr:hypothetical protein [Ferrovibrio sp.]HLT77114.1 hypothetical protein [Ferrovibrio sp.]
MTRPPPVPPQNQPPKQRNLADQGNAPGTGAAKESGSRTTDRNAHKGRHADISQNTRHQGYQQDR